MPEPRQVRWLREFSNYLTPRVGAFSTDNLSGVATYLRNLLLNQTMLVAFGASLLVLPWLLVALLPHLAEGWIAVGLAFAAALLLAGSTFAGYETLRADTGLTGENATEKAKTEDREDAARAIRRARRRFRYLSICFAIFLLSVSIQISNSAEKQLIGVTPEVFVINDLNHDLNGEDPQLDAEIGKVMDFVK